MFCDPKVKVITEEVFSSYGFAKLLEFVTPRRLLCLFEHERKNMYTLRDTHPFMEYLCNLDEKEKRNENKFIELLIDLKYELAFYPNKISRDKNEVLNVKLEIGKIQWVTIEG